MEPLSSSHLTQLAGFVTEDHGPDLSRPAFADALAALLDDVPGCEALAEIQLSHYIEAAWSIYMSKELDLTKFTAEIELGKKLTAEGATKAAASMEVYQRIKDQPRDVAAAVFVAGVGLTEKGAVTYWYNCKRKSEKKTKAKPSK